jgi:cytoskeletal protein RodZ
MGRPEPQAGIGELLSRRRESLGLTREQVYAELRIPVRYLEALEEERFDLFPAPHYARGFLRSYATFLGLDPEPILPRCPPPLPPGPALTAQGRMPIYPVRQGARWHRLLRWFLFIFLAGFVAAGYLVYREVRAFLESAPGPPRAAHPVAVPSPSPQLVPDLPAPLPPSPGVRVTLVADEVSWIRILADDRRAFEGFLRRGERKEWTARRRIHVVLGNAGGVRVEVNGRDLGRLGGPGEVVRRTFEGQDGAR